MRILSLYLGVIIVTVGAFELDSHLSSIWQRNSGMIHEIARKRACRNGRIPILTDIKSEGELTTYNLECEDTLGNEVNGLEKRQTQTMCTTDCTQTCYHPADYNPDPKDCGKQRNPGPKAEDHWDVTVGGTTVVQWKTCLYTFTNQAHNTINFCDTAWGSIGNSIAWTCGRWLSNPAKGGICSTTPFYVEAIRTPNMPGPSYTIQLSTGPTTRFDAPNTNPGTGASSSALPTGSGNSLLGTITQGTSSVSQNSLNMSAVQIQSLPGAPTASLGGEHSDGTGVGANPTGASVGPIPSTKSDTAAAVGGAIGGIAFLALLIACIFLYRRMVHREKRTDDPSFISPMTQQVAWTIPAEGYRTEKRPRQLESPPFAETSVISHPDTADHSAITSSIVSNEIPRPHPRSTEALIAAAAPPNMSREQIDLLTANFVSLVRGRHPQEPTEDGEAPELPPYHRD